jgi:hypothetical protein
MKNKKPRPSRPPNARVSPPRRNTHTRLQPDRVRAAQPVAESAGITSSASERSASLSFPVVGVGASAGGLEAFTQLLDELPSDTGMAFVLIQHLDPTHTSFLADALTKATKMSVAQAQDGESIKPNHIYVIPPDADIAILHGLLTLLPRKSEARKLHLPIDFFLRSLAQERGNHAIGVILSGTASDGTEGLRAIKAEDGITLVQDPNTAKFDGMPRSALNAGVVDYSLSLPELARELVRLSTHPYVAAATAHPPKTNDALLNHIYALLRNSVGVDFSEYKAPSFERRLARRMALRKVDSLQIYPLRGHPHSRHFLLPGPGSVRKSEDQGFSRHSEEEVSARPDPHLGGGVFHRRRGVLARHHPSRMPG